MKMTRYLKCFYLIVLPFSINACYAGALDIELLPHSKATYLASRGRNIQAAEQWHKLTLIFLRSEAKLGQKKMWQYAGISEALAAIAADKANNVIAYQYWADSTRYLMTGGTNWEQMKARLYHRYKTADLQLSTFLRMNELSSSADEQWQKELATLQIWDEKLDLFSFESPKLGLKAQFSSEPVSTSVPPRAVYYAPSVPGKKLSGLKESFTREKHLIPTEHSQVAPSSAPQSSVRVEKAPAVQKIIFETQVESRDRLIDADRVVVFPAGSQKTDKQNPLARGSLVPTEGNNVEALQRRGVNPVSK